MGIPNIKDLIMYVNKALHGNAWNTNRQKVINWLTDGKTNIVVKNITVASGGAIENNGSLTQNGDLTVTGNLEVGNIKANGRIEGDGSGLYNLQTQGVQAFTPFCVNSGNVDSSGNADIIKATSVNEGGVTTKIIVEFKVGNLGGDEFPNIRATTAEGSTFLLEQLGQNELAVEGSFYYFIGQNQTAVTRLKDINIYRQPSAPVAPLTVNVNDVWLDTSTENLVSYKYSEAGIWEKWDYVPLGKVVVPNTIGSAEIEATVTTFEYNSNTYNLTNTYNNRLNIATALAPDMSTETSVASGVQYTQRPILIKVTTSGQNDRYVALSILVGETDSTVNKEIWKCNWNGAAIVMTNWLIIPAKTYYSLSGDISVVSSVLKYEIMGYSTDYYKKLN